MQSWNLQTSFWQSWLLRGRGGLKGVVGESKIAKSIMPHGCPMAAIWVSRCCHGLWLPYGNYRIGEADSFVSRAEHPTAAAFPRNARPSGHVMRRVLDGMTWKYLECSIIALASQMFPDLEWNKCWERVHDKVLIHDIHISSTRSDSLQLWVWLWGQILILGVNPVSDELRLAQYISVYLSMFSNGGGQLCHLCL